MADDDSEAGAPAPGQHRARRAPSDDAADMPYAGDECEVVAPSDVLVHGRGGMEDVLEVLGDIAEVHRAETREGEITRKFDSPNEFEGLVNRVDNRWATVVLRKLFLYRGNPREPAKCSVMQEIWIQDKRHPDVVAARNPFKSYAVAHVHHHSSRRVDRVEDITPEHLAVVDAINFRHICDRGSKYQGDNPFFDTYIEPSGGDTLKVFPDGNWRCSKCGQDNWQSKPSCRGRRGAACAGVRPCREWQWTVDSQLNAGLAQILRAADETLQWASGSGKSMARAAGGGSSQVHAERLDSLRSAYITRGPRKPASGLKWKSVGVTEPTTGRALDNPALASALTSRTELTQAEWDAFGIDDLCMDHHIKSGAHYLKPATPAAHIQGAGTTCAHESPLGTVTAAAQPMLDSSLLPDPAPMQSPFSVLFAGANMERHAQLRIKEECQIIRKELHSRFGEDAWRPYATFQADCFADPASFMHDVMEIGPGILQFSCHGETRGLWFSEGFTEASAIVDALRAHNRQVETEGSQRIQLVVVNACMSGPLAQALCECVDFVIGHGHSEVGDEEALTFSKTLYYSLGRGMSLDGSFKAAKLASEPFHLYQRFNSDKFFLPVPNLSKGGVHGRVSENTTAGTPTPSTPLGSTCNDDLKDFLERLDLLEFLEDVRSHLRVKSLRNLQSAYRRGDLESAEMPNFPNWAKQDLLEGVAQLLSPNADQILSPMSDQNLSQASTPLMQSPRDSEVIGIHHAGDPEALCQHVALLFKHFDYFYDLHDPDATDDSNEISNETTFEVPSTFYGHWTFCMLIWSAFVGNAHMSQGSYDDWLRRCQLFPRQHDLLPVIDEMIRGCKIHDHSQLGEIKTKLAQYGCRPIEDCVAAIVVIDVVVQEHLAEMDKTKWQTDVVNGWYNSSDGPKEFLLRANRFLRKSIDGIKILQKAFETGSYVMYMTMSSLAALLLFEHLELTKRRCIQIVTRKSGRELPIHTAIHGFRLFVSSSGRVLMKDDACMPEPSVLPIIVQGLRCAAHLQNEEWEMLGPFIRLAKLREDRGLVLAAVQQGGMTHRKEEGSDDDKSFDPSEASEDSFDPDQVPDDDDAASAASFDPEKSGSRLASEKSFDPDRDPDDEQDLSGFDEEQSKNVATISADVAQRAMAHLHSSANAELQKLRQEVEELTRAKMLLKGSLHLQSELDDVKKGLEDAEGRAAEAAQKVEDLLAQVKALEEAQGKLESQLGDTVKERGDASQELEAKTAEAAAAHKEIAQLQSALAAETSAKDAASSKSEETEKALSAESAARAAADGKVAELEKNVAALQSELDDARKAAEDTRANLGGEAAQLSQALEKARAEGKTLAQERDALSGEVKSLKNNVASISAEREEERKKSAADAEEQQQEAERRKQELEEQLAAAKEQGAAAAQALATEKDERQADKDKAARETDALKLQVGAGEKELAGKVRQLDAERERAVAAESNVELLEGKMQTQVREASATADELARKEEELSQLRDARSELEAKHAMLLEEKQALADELATLQSMHGETSEKVKMTQGELMRAKEEREAVAAAHKQSQEEQAKTAAKLGMTLAEYKEQLAAKEAEADPRSASKQKAELKGKAAAALEAAQVALAQGRYEDAAAKGAEAKRLSEEAHGMSKVTDKDVRESITQATALIGLAEAGVQRVREEELKRRSQEEAMEAFEGLCGYVCAGTLDGGLGWAQKAAAVRECFEDEKRTIESLETALGEAEKRHVELAQEAELTIESLETALGEAEKRHVELAQEAELADQKYRAELEQAAEDKRQISCERDRLTAENTELNEELNQCLRAFEKEAQRVARREAGEKFLQAANVQAAELAKAKEDKEKMAKDLVGKRKVHKEKGKEAGLGFTYKKLSNGLFEVSKIKPGGFAEKSGLIQPKDVVHFVDGTPCAGIAGPMTFAELLTGPVGSTCELSLSRGASEYVFVVTCTRMVAEAPAGAQGDLTSAVAAAASEQVKAPKDEDLQSIKSEASQSKSKAVSLGFTYKVGKDGRWKASTIKPGGWAQQSGEVKTGDIIVTVNSQATAGLDLKAFTRLLQGEEGSKVLLTIERYGKEKSVEGTRIKCA